MQIIKIDRILNDTTISMFMHSANMILVLIKFFEIKFWPPYQKNCDYMQIPQSVIFMNDPTFPSFFGDKEYFRIYFYDFNSNFAHIVKKSYCLFNK